MSASRGYGDNAEPRWYSGQQDSEGGWNRRGDGGSRDDDLRVPEPRTVPVHPYGAPAEQDAQPPRHANPEWPTQPGRGDVSRQLDSPTNPLSAVSPGAPSISGPPPPVGGPPPVPGQVPAAAARAREGVYRTRRPATAILYLIVVVFFEWPAIRLFADGALGDDLSSSNAVCGIFLILGLPLAGRGLFALQAGAGRMLDQRAGHGWLRPPVAYLIVGLALLVAAGLAAS